jgi:hypothetical protein
VRVEREPLTTALAEALAAATGYLVGVGRAPEGVPDTDPYGVVYPIGGGGFDNVAWGNVDAVWVYQVTSVGHTHDQAQWMADRVERALLGTEPPAVAVVGLAVMGVDKDTHGGVDAEGSLWSIPDRYAFSVTPA